MTTATENSLRESRLKRYSEKQRRAGTRLAGRGITSGYVRRGTAISPYSKENKYS